MKIHFLGAAREVTGSCHLIEINGRRLLLDCGLIQGSAAEERRNREPFPFDPRHLDAVVLSHAHLDHSGRIPLLVKTGYKGPVYAQRATRDLCQIMLKDAGHLNEKDAEWDNRKRRRKGLELVEPLYTLREAQDAMGAFKALDYDTPRRILPGVTLRLLDAGHILGSSIVELELEEDGVTRRVVFSGDLGHRDAPILRDPTPVESADLVLMESTYGDRLHRPWADTWEELAGILAEADRRRGNILIPAFAVGRSQELLYVFERNFDDWHLNQWTLFLDSPMAIEATEVYARHWKLYDREAAASRADNGGLFNLPNLHFTRTARQSMAINQVESGALIMAGSGMCTGGRIKHHLKHNLWRDHCHVVIVGFQARGTLGRALVDGARHVRLWGETIKVAARVHTVGGLSAHADQQGLLAWYRHFRGRPPVALVHGEPEPLEHLQGRLQAEDAPAWIPRRNEVLDLARLPDRGRAQGSA